MQIVKVNPVTHPLLLLVLGVTVFWVILPDNGMRKLEQKVLCLFLEKKNAEVLIFHRKLGLKFYVNRLHTIQMKCQALLSQKNKIKKVHRPLQI